MTMTGPVNGSSRSPGEAAQAARLREAIHQLEGVFVEQLFAAMRETVPSDGLLDGGPGGKMFSELLDEHLAAQAPRRWNNAGLAASLWRQLYGGEMVPPTPADPNTP